MCDNIIGSGSGSVYVYYYPTYKAFAELKGESVYRCKVGISRTEALGRVRSQVTAAPEVPVVGLVILTDTPKATEKVIHSMLEMRGKRMTDTPGQEWYATNPSEVEKIFELITTSMIC